MCEGRVREFYIDLFLYISSLKKLFLNCQVPLILMGRKASGYCFIALFVMKVI